jgi:hypothetical protein
MLLLLECRERNGYLLVTDVEVPPNIHDDCGHAAVRPNEDVYYRP